MSADRDDRIGQLCEELQLMLAAGESIDRARLARRFEVEEDEVARVEAALQFVHGALDDDEEAGELTPPDLPDDYELLGELGRGGMGIVYRAHQKSLDRDLAVKVLRPGDLMFRDALQRFEREAKSLARLRHRHIVSVHEVGKADGFVYFTMDLVDGQTLAERLRESPLTTAQTVRLLLQVTSAIAYAHGKGVMHRDLKPQNILLDRDDDAFVVDFGLARDLSTNDGATVTGQMLGTPAYMAPEQALGDQARIGEASDVYALGAILYECLAGRAPFEGLPLAQLMHAVIEQEPDSLAKHNARVPQDLQVICQKAMQKNPGERYATVQALAEDLERFSIGQPILARPRSMWSHSVRFVQRHRRSILGAAVPLMVLLACAWWFVLPAVMRSRTLELAERMQAAGSPQGAVAAYREIYEEVDVADMTLADRIRYLRALIDEAGRLYVDGDNADVAAAQELTAEARRMLGNFHSPFPTRDPSGSYASAEMQLEVMRLEALDPEHERNPHFEREPLRERILTRDSQSGQAADLLFALWSVPVLGSAEAARTKRQRDAIVRLLPIANRLPPHLRQRLLVAARVDEITSPYEFVDEQYLGQLVAIAGDHSVPLEQRKNAAALFHLSDWMPFLTKRQQVVDGRSEYPRLLVEDADLAWLQQAWAQLAGLDRIGRYRRRIDFVVERLTKLGPSANDRSDLGRELLSWVRQHTGHYFGYADTLSFWRANRTKDPRELLRQPLEGKPALDIDVLLAGFRSTNSHSYHNLLTLVAPEGTPIAHYQKWFPKPTLMRWYRALDRLPQPTRMLRAATFVIVDGEVTPRLVGSFRTVLELGKQLERQIQFGDEMSFLGARLDWRRWRPNGTRNRGLGVFVTATLQQQQDEFFLEAHGFVGGSRPVGVGRQIVYDRESKIPDAHVGFLGGVGWRTHDKHARFDCFTLATLQPIVEPDRAWTREEWLAAYGKTLMEISGDQHHAVNNAKHIATATFFPMVEGLEHLRRFDALVSDSFAPQYVKIARKAALLLAGDESAVDYDTSNADGHSREFLDDNFLVRLASTTSSPKIRDYAFERLKYTGPGSDLLRTIGANQQLRPYLPAWLADRANGANSKLWAFVSYHWWRLLLFAFHLLWSALAISRMRRSTGVRRFWGLMMLVPAGMLFTLWNVHIAGIQWNVHWYGHTLHVLGVWAFCWRATRGIAWQIVGLMWTGATLAHVTGYLDHAWIAWIVASVAVLTLPMHRKHISVPRGDGALPAIT